MFAFEGAGSTEPFLLDPSLVYTVPPTARRSSSTSAAGNASAHLIYVVIMRDGEPMRYFPIGAQAGTHVALRWSRTCWPTRALELFVAAPEGARSDRRRRRAGGDLMRLVVIGNGMAGARTVEEIIDRGDATSTSRCSATSRTATTTGSRSPTCSRPARIRRDIFLNPLDWYDENGVTLHAGVRDRRASTASPRP